MKKFECVLIRHGKTAGNLEKRYIGRTDEKLCEDGKKELEDLVSKRYYPKVDVLFSSPKIRCLETASILYPNQQPIVIDDFREMDFGLFEGKNYLDLTGNTDYQAFIDSGGSLPFPEGETRDAFEKRCAEGFKEMVQKLISMESEICKVGMVVHGGTIMALLHVFAREKKPYYFYQIKNGKGLKCILQMEDTELFLTDVEIL